MMIWMNSISTSPFIPFVTCRPQNFSSSRRSPISLWPFLMIADGTSRTEARLRFCHLDAERVAILCLKSVQIHVRFFLPSRPPLLPHTWCKFVSTSIHSSGGASNINDVYLWFHIMLTSCTRSQHLRIAHGPSSHTMHC